MERVKRETRNKYPKISKIIELTGSAKLGICINSIFEEILHNFQENILSEEE